MVKSFHRQAELGFKNVLQNYKTLSWLEKDYYTFFQTIKYASSRVYYLTTALSYNQTMADFNDNSSKYISETVLPVFNNYQNKPWRHF